MADALNISGHVLYDGDQPLAKDPFAVQVAVEDLDGDPIGGADREHRGPERRVVRGDGGGNLMTDC